jgi:hypothetical protein
LVLRALGDAGAADTGELRAELPDGSDVRPGIYARQSHRHRKSPPGLNATAVRQWLDEHVLTRLIERYGGSAASSVVVVALTLSAAG